VRGQRVVPLGVDRFGQAGDITDLYLDYGLDGLVIIVPSVSTDHKRPFGNVGPPGNDSIEHGLNEVIQIVCTHELLRLLP
jgi:hypothetical protein